MTGQYLIGLPVEQLPTPALVLDYEAFMHNIQAMSTYLAKVKMNIRPHAKTHKTPTIAHIQMNAGAIGVCCATVGEAEIMAYSGIGNILIANEVISEVAIRRVANLARHAKIMVVIDEPENARVLSKAAVQYGAALDVLVDLDVGLGRCGLRSEEQLVELAKLVNKLPGLSFRGVFGYEGQVQFLPDRDERTKQGRAANNRLVQAAKAISSAGLQVDIVSGAGTGTYDIAAEFPGITEIQAGSYIFMDGTYQKLGLPFTQSLTVLSMVVSRPTDELAIFDVGLKGISPERFNPSVKGHESTIEVKKLSEEHAVAHVQGGIDPRPGDRLHFIPSHCCTTVNLYNNIFVTRDGRVEAIWPIAARRA